MRPGTVVGHRFVIDREAGAGGMGTVYLAFDRVTGDAVALKMLRGDDAVDAERFDQEAEILARLDHPGIVRYISHDVTTSGERWLAMEWLEGEDLAQRLSRARLSLAECLAVGRRAASALAHAHVRGMVHRDLKPSNLFLPGGRVDRMKVLDFGIARIAGNPRRLTSTGMILGTLGYVAPEQIQGTCEADPRADVFALGAVLFECLTGRPAFPGAHPMAVLAKILLHGPPLLSVLRPDLPDALDVLVERMMAKERAERPANGAEVIAALMEIGALEEPPGGPPPPRPTLPSAPLGPPSSGRGPESFGHDEQRLASVVLAGAVDAGGALDGTHSAELLRVLAPFGGRIALCDRDAVMVTIWSNGDARDRAERAAGSALALRAHAPELPICVMTGRGQVAQHLLSGGVIDRGVSALRETPPGTVHIDEATASALGPRFVVQRGAHGLVLAGALAADESAPHLLGKAVPCFGRERELRILMSAYDGCAGEATAGAVLVVGPCGAGKSRLRRELSDRLLRRSTRLEVLLGRGAARAAGSPLGLVADAVRRAAGIRSSQPLDERRQKLEARVGRRIGPPAAARVAAFLGELSGTPFPDDHPALCAARRDRALMGAAIREAWLDWLAAECAAGPMLLVLEDLHLVDAATVQLVDLTLQNLRELPLMVLCTARPEVLERFPGLWAARGLSMLQLGPLSRRAGEALVRHALGADAPCEVVARIVEQGGGNPFYLQELVRAVADGRGEVLPASVLDAVEARLDAEGADAKRALRAASVFGTRFTREGLIALTGATPQVAEAWLTRLSERELVAPASGPRRPDDGDYVIRDTLVREAAYATLTDDDRALGHQLAGEWLERTGHTDAVVLEDHFRRSGHPPAGEHEAGAALTTRSSGAARRILPGSA